MVESNLEQNYLSLFEKASRKIEALLADNLKLKQRGPIAVVGMGCRFAGGVDSPGSLWSLLESQVDVVGVAPQDRCDLNRFYDVDRDAPGRTYVREGAFLDRVDGFDARFFGIAPLEAEALDPQQRLLLEVCWEALEHAGLDAHRLCGSRTGVYVGMSNVDYFQAHIHSGQLARVTPHAATGVMFSTAAGRLAYTFDFRGPVLTLDTACSASLLCVHLAVGALRRHEADLAVAGGVNLMLSPAGFVALAKTQGLSPDGRCRPFDAGASGYGRGEGCGLLVLKRLSDALDGGDRVLAVLEGSATNHDGRSNGLTAPNGPAQEAVVRAALEDAGVSAASVGYVEAHGSATVLGDPVEAHALGRVFSRATQQQQPLLIGSVKGNLGHTEAAAGALGLIKAVLAVQRGELPPTLHLQAPNPLIPFDELGLDPVVRQRAWPASLSEPRRAGVSSFGLSGTNVHVVVASPPERAPPLDTRTQLAANGRPSAGGAPCQLLVLSAKTSSALQARMRSMRDWLERTSVGFEAVCHTAAVGRAHFAHRVAILAESASSAVAQLDSLTLGQETRSSFRGSVLAEESSRVVFLFSRLCAQLDGPTLWASLLGHPAGRQALEACDAAARSLLGSLPLGGLWELEAFPIAPPPKVALAGQFALQYATCALWRACGVRPAAVLGQAGGEWAAACVAGAVSLEEALASALTAVDASVAVADGVRQEASRAAHDDPEWRIPGTLASATRDLELPLYCTPSGKRHHTLRPNDWQRIGAPGSSAAAVEAAVADGYRTFLEVGSTDELCQLVLAQTTPDAVLALPTLANDADGRRSFLLALAQLYVGGLAIDWLPLSAHRSLEKVDLPTYPFERRSFWLPVVGEAEPPMPGAAAPTAPTVSTEPKPTWHPSDEGDPGLGAALRQQRSPFPGGDVGLGPAVTSEPGAATHAADGGETVAGRVSRSGVDGLARAQLQSLESVLLGNLSAARQLVDTQLRWLAALAQGTDDEPRQPASLGAPEAGVPACAEDGSVERQVPPSVAFEAQVRQHGSKVAIEAGAEAVSYAELNRRANRLAHALVTRGAGPDVVVAVALPRGVDYLAAFLAVAKARALLLPVDAVMPRQRLGSIFQQAQPSLLVASEHTWRLLEAAGIADDARPSTVLLLTAGTLRASDRGGAPDSASTLVDLPDEDLRAKPEPNQNAYMMFTSGSTGKPKALLGTHAGLSHFMAWELAELGPAAGARVSALSAITFDASLRDMLLPLLSGGTVCVPPHHVREDPNLLLSWVSDARIVTLHTVPSVLRLLLDALEAEARPAPALPELQFVLVAGEPLRVGDVERFVAALGRGPTLFNLYGASETTMVKLFHRVDAPSGPPQAIVSIGVPMPGVEVFLVKDERSARPGEIGEICIQTPYPCPGYFRDPERTAQVFVKNPLSADPGAVMYRSGDLGRRLASGAYEFVGRLDRQVKIAGVRVELAEVEQALLASPEVREAHACTLPGDDGQPLLVAYYSLRTGLEERCLRQRLLDHLPRALLPSYLLVLERLPLNLHGKVDTQALPAPTLLLAESGEERTGPETDTERALLGIWQDVLGVRGFGVESAFVEVGGNSLRALRVLARVHRDLGASIRIRDFFEDGTIRRLGHRIDEARFSATRSIMRAPEQPDYPLSPAQRRLWMLDRLTQDCSEYNLASAFRIDGRLDRQALLLALESLIERHESLRTTFPKVLDEPRQRILPTGQPVARFVDLGADPNAFACAMAQAREILTQRYDLGRGPLFRARLLRVSEECHVLAVGLHHIISDGASQSVLARDLGVTYQALSRRERPRLPQLAIRYRDHACEQQARHSSDDAAVDGAYWTKQLADAVPVELPSDRTASSVPTNRGSSVSVQLPPELCGGLLHLASSQSTSLFMVLVSLVKVLLHRYTGQTDLLVGSPWAGRDRPELDDQVGLFVNLLPLRDHVHPEDTFTHVLCHVRDTVTLALEHAAYPFDRMLRDLAAARDGRLEPLVDVLITLQDFEHQSLELEGLQVTELELEQSTSRFPLAWEFATTPTGGLNLRVEYATERFDHARIDRAIAHLETLANAAIEEPGRAICELRLLPEAERSLLIHDFNATIHSLRTDVTLLDLFERHLEAPLDAPAVMDETGGLSRPGLDREAERLARRLRAGGAGPGETVAVLLPRGNSVVVAFLAVLKCGGIYLPLDPTYPAERLAFMLRDSGCRWVVTSQACSESALHITDLLREAESTSVAPNPTTPDSTAEARPQTSISLVRLDSRDDPGEDTRFGRIELGRPTPDASAYLIYTSGSTGNPKGVVCQHRGLANLAQAQIAAFDVKPGDRVLQLAALGFDASIAELAQALGSGATLVVGPAPGSLRPSELLDVLRQQAITLATFSPSLLAEVEPEPLPALKALVVAGEPCPVQLMNRWAARVPFYNAYGPTEATVCATMGRCEAGAPLASIGRSIDNVQVYVLDPRLQPTPIGVAGELCIAGVGVARGYLHRPDLSARHFVPDPFSQSPGATLYRSGDRARYRADGSLEFLGRSDRCVKLRGFRVEPGEVEHALGAVDGVVACAVVKREDCSEVDPWVAYVVVRDVAPSNAELRQALRERLPAHFVPSRFVRLAALPLTPHGKIDYAALPLPDSPQARTVHNPRDDLERSLLEAYQELLGVAHCGLEDDFFDLGGHSLVAIKLFDRIERRHGVSLPLSALVQAGTVQKLSSLVRAQTLLGPPRLLVSLAGQAMDNPVVCIHPGGGDVLCFSALARELGCERPVYGLKAVGLESSEMPLTDVRRMAERYLAEIERAGLPSPVHLVGYSFGGLVAYEMAHQLRQAAGESGRKLGLVALVDTPCPSAGPASQKPAPSEAAVEVLLHAARGRVEATYEELGPLDDAARIALLSERAAHTQGNDGAVSPQRLTNSLRVHLSCFRAMHDYVVPSERIRLLLFRARQHDARLASEWPGPDLGWQTATRNNVDVLWVPGDHDAMLEGAGAREIAATMLREIRAREASVQSTSTEPDPAHGRAQFDP